MMLLASPPADRHSLFEDVFGIFTGVILVSLSVLLLRSSELITGQIAGLSLVASYALNGSFGVFFVAFNLPFYVLAVRQLGWRFTIKSFASVSLLSVITELMPMGLQVQPLHPGVAALLAGVLAGVGLLMLFRHGATLGGIGIVALWLQDTRGIKAGHVQLGFDLCVFLLALALFDWSVVVWSLLGAVLLNLVITVNHRRDRYIARS